MVTIDTIMHPSAARPSAAHVKAAFAATAAMAEAIRELGEVPSGTLYASVCGRMDISSYEAIIRTLKGAGLVTESAHVLRWCGPKFAEVLA